MKSLDDAVSLALAGTKLTPRHVELVAGATILDLIDLGLNFPEIELLKRLVQVQAQRNKSQAETYPFNEGKRELYRLLKEELGMMGLQPLGSSEEFSFTDDVVGLGGDEAFAVDYEAGHVEDEDRMMGGGGTSRLARQQLNSIGQAAQSLYDSLSDEDEVPEWTQSHIAQAQQMLDNVAEYLQYKMLTHEMHDES